MVKGLFIVFEGNNGAGKTTIINELMKNLNTQSTILDNIDNKPIYEWNVYKFPNRSTVLGKKIDDFLKKKITFNSKELELKFFADNRKEFKVEMNKILNKGYNIICDRYIYSSMAYTLTNQTIDVLNDKNIKILSIDNILYYDRSFIKPDFVFVIKGEFLHLRNEKEELYHKNKMFNNILLNNYILSIQKTDTSFAIVDNAFGELKETIEIITFKIDELLVKKNEIFNKFLNIKN